MSHRHSRAQHCPMSTGQLGKRPQLLVHVHVHSGDPYLWKHVPQPQHHMTVAASATPRACRWGFFDPPAPTIVAHPEQKGPTDLKGYGVGQGFNTTKMSQPVRRFSCEPADSSPISMRDQDPIRQPMRQPVRSSRRCGPEQSRRSNLLQVPPRRWRQCPPNEP